MFRVSRQSLRPPSDESLEHVKNRELFMLKGVTHSSFTGSGANISVVERQHNHG